MSYLPFKRRKLDHDNANESDGSSQPDGENPEEETLEVDTPATKQAQSQQKRTKDDDDSALYAGGLYKSSLFKLQVDEMLAEVRPNYGKRFSGADDDLRQLKGLIEGIADREGLSVSTTSSRYIFLC